MGCSEETKTSDAPKEEAKAEETIEEVQLQAIKSTYPKIYEAMKQVPACLIQAKAHDDIATCNHAVKRLNKELAVSMGYIIEETLPSSTETMSKEAQIIQRQKSIEEMKTTLSCIQEVESMEEVEGCLDKGLEQ